jgi:UDP-2,3-diacylglucosamine hydrolase
MIYFISDVHLGFRNREQEIEKENLLLKLLGRISKDCEQLFIVGDLFDFWFDYKTVIPKYYYRTLTALKTMTENGIPIEYIIGNHDFGHYDFFEKELDIRLFRNDIERTLKGKKFYLSHGDGKANNDAGYKFIKKIMRNSLSQSLYRKLHPDCGIRLASSSSKKSRDYTDKKNFGQSDGMNEFAVEKIEQGFDFVIMGHRHRVVQNQHKNGFYYNLGDWLHEPTFGTFDGELFKILFVKSFLGVS